MTIEVAISTHATFSFDHIDLPCTRGREVVFDRNDRCELNGDESRSLATIQGSG